jgi:hypothetical protein
MRKPGFQQLPFGRKRKRVKRKRVWIREKREKVVTLPASKLEADWIRDSIHPEEPLSPAIVPQIDRRPMTRSPSIVVVAR